MGTWRGRRVGIQGWIGGKEGLDSLLPGGTGNDSAEVWFKKVQGDRLVEL